MSRLIVHLGHCRRCNTNSISQGKVQTPRDVLALLMLQRIYRCSECGYTRYRLGRRKVRTVLALLIVGTAIWVISTVVEDQIKGMERHDPLPKPHGALLIRSNFA